MLLIVFGIVGWFPCPEYGLYLLIVVCRRPTVARTDIDPGYRIVPRRAITIGNNMPATLVIVTTAQSLLTKIIHFIKIRL